METSRKDDILIVVRCEVKNQTEACEGPSTHRKILIEKGRSFYDFPSCS